MPGGCPSLVPLLTELIGAGDRSEGSGRDAARWFRVRMLSSFISALGDLRGFVFGSRRLSRGIFAE